MKYKTLEVDCPNNQCRQPRTYRHHARWDMTEFGGGIINLYNCDSCGSTLSDVFMEEEGIVRRVIALARLCMMRMKE